MYLLWLVHVTCVSSILHVTRLLPFKYKSSDYLDHKSIFQIHLSCFSFFYWNRKFSAVLLKIFFYVMCYVVWFSIVFPTNRAESAFYSFLFPKRSVSVVLFVLKTTLFWHQYQVTKPFPNLIKWLDKKQNKTKQTCNSTAADLIRGNSHVR